MENEDASNFNSRKVYWNIEGDTSMPTRLTQAEKTKMVNKARSDIILYLKDKILGKSLERRLWF